MVKLLTACLVLLSAPPVAPAAARLEGSQREQERRPARDGRPAPTSQPADQSRRALEARLAEARARYERNPDDPEAIIWLGRRAAYLGRYEEAVRVFTEGVEKHPRDARFLRHRGHRYITLRRFDLAVKDLERAAKLIKGRPDQVEPDGLPNARNVPTSTLNTNVFYHLGLAHYLRGDFKRAARAYRECLKFSDNPDMLAATAHWLYMTLRRLKRVDDARAVLALVRDDADIIENRDYQRLLLVYKGTLSPDWLLAEAAKDKNALGFSTVAYAVGNWHLYHGEREWARRIFLQILDGPQRTSFGYIAAEAELKRMSK